MKRIFILAPILILGTFLPIHAQEALLSENEQYYEFLVLEGLAERPYLNYRTLSDSSWEILSFGHPWDGLYLGESRGGDIRYRLYGPELFSSYNSSAPWGSNDGVLWQGKGFNSSFTAGVRLEAWGFELTLKPMISFSQNLSFDLVPPAYTGANFDGKAADYGYFGVKHIDAPQRFGDEPFFDWSLGDSEIRYTWKTITAGFGTQAIWLGPGKINSIMHSNNAAPYPKLDIGLRRTELYLPWLGWYIGDVEARLWCGYLSESDWFDNDDSNDHNMLSGLAIAYAPSFLEGLTLFANRTYLAKWDIDSARTLYKLLIIDLEGGGAQDVWDQRASLGFSWLFPLVGLEVYGELGINDYGPSLDGYIRYPFHSMVYLTGLVKNFEIPFTDNFKGQLLFEWQHMEMSQDFQFQWPSTFYAHHEITQGYTNRGQWLGAGIGTGGNSQYLGIKAYSRNSVASLFFHRVNTDNDYIYAKSVHTDNKWDIQDFKAVIHLGAAYQFFLLDGMSLKFGLSYITEHNPVFESINWSRTNERRGFNATAQLAYSF